jgi:cytochrome c oxidase subunit 2
MRGQVVVDNASSYQKWLSSQVTFADVLSGGTVEGLVDQGQRLASSRGCIACHSIDGTPSLGPGWLDLYGSQETLSDGSQVKVDGPYLIESVIDPAAKIVAGYPPVMVAYQMSDEQLDSLVAYIASLSSDPDNSMSIQPSIEE